MRAPLTTAASWFPSSDEQTAHHEALVPRGDHTAPGTEGVRRTNDSAAAGAPSTESTPAAGRVVSLTLAKALGGTSKGSLKPKSEAEKIHGTF
jgi:hypothetical protein